MAADGGPGVVPPELVPYLPKGFTFTYPSYQLDFDNRSPSMSPYQLAVSMTTTDDRLMAALQRTLGNNAPYYFAGNRLTYILIDQSGNY